MTGMEVVRICITVVQFSGRVSFCNDIKWLCKSIYKYTDIEPDEVLSSMHEL